LASVSVPVLLESPASAGCDGFGDDVVCDVFVLSLEDVDVVSFGALPDG
jgi:hypothetical protein